jgi:hypothetical protein
MDSHARLAFVSSVAMIVAASAIAPAATKFTSTWKAPEAAQVRFAGKKVAALVISKDDNLRVSGEEGLARELEARGLQPVAAYRLIPKEELLDAARARGWFERAGVEGIVAMRPVGMDKKRTYTPSTWSTPYYGTLWGYYGYGWGAVYDPGYVREDAILVIETLIFSVPRDKLLWAGVSETTNPKNAAKLLADVVKAAVAEMRKEGLTGGGGQ